MKILLVEDDGSTAAHIIHCLSKLGHKVDHRISGREVLSLVADESYDVLIVDRMLPAIDGLSLVRSMREAHIETPTLFLTALGGIDDRVEGLEVGGDDYLVKPFATNELAARINALGRRFARATDRNTLKVADLELDLFQRTAKRAFIMIDLQPREFQLLEYLVRNVGEVVTRSMLLEKVWDFHFDPKTNIVETHISRLRAKVDRGQDRPLIETVRGKGYRLRDYA